MVLRSSGWSWLLQPRRERSEIEHQEHAQTMLAQHGHGWHAAWSQYSKFSRNRQQQIVSIPGLLGLADRHMMAALRIVLLLASLVGFVAAVSCDNSNNWLINVGLTANDSW